jgi:hypothetical protein
MEVPAGMEPPLLWTRAGDLVAGTVAKISSDMATDVGANPSSKALFHITDGYVETAVRDDTARAEAVQVAYCAEAGDDVYLMPDHYAELTAIEYLRKRRVPWPRETAWRHFRARKRKVFWRGNAHGPFPDPPEGLSGVDMNHRLRLVRAASAFPQSMDVKILISGALDNQPGVREVVTREQLWAPRVRESEFQNHQVYLDVDGWSASWGTVRRHLLMCMVVYAPSRWNLAFHSRLEHGVNCLVAPSLAPSGILGTLERYSEVETFEIAYAGHLAAYEWLHEVQTGSWSLVHNSSVSFRDNAKLRNESARMK